MQDYTKTRWVPAYTFIFFLATLVIAYLPVSSFLFFLKNDAFNGYFPAKFFISESLYAGHVPWWNPYINYGLPQYGDMNSGFWSPITWLIASTTGYTAYSFTIELLLYLFIAGSGMFVLCRSYRLTLTVSLIAGTAYMCSGYMVGHLQHFNWISGAAFIPFTFWSYRRLQKRFSVKNIIIAANLFYLFTASAHPGIIIGAIYFFTAYTVYYFFRHQHDQKSTFTFSKWIRSNALLVVSLLLLGAGMITGYADILPHITRGEKVNSIAAMANPVSLQSSVSLLLPLSITKNDAFFGTDLSMRNIYFGIPLLIFFMYALFSRKSGVQKFFLFAGLFFFLLSLGGIFKQFSWNYLPLMAYVRLNGEFAIFALFCFILFAAFSMDKYLKNNQGFSGKTVYIYYLTEALLFIAIAIGIYKTLSTHQGFLYQANTSILQPGIDLKLKSLIDSISFYDTLWLQGLIQLLLLWGIKYGLKKKRQSLLLRISIADLVLATLLNIPFTGVGKASVHDVQAVLNKAPHGLPVPGMQPINKYLPEVSKEESMLVGDWSFYNKQIGVPSFAFYPVELKKSHKIFEDSLSIYAEKPFLFSVQNDKARELIILSFEGHSIDARIKSTLQDSIVFQQNNYPHWSTYYDGKKITTSAYKDVFISAAYDKGIHTIRFTFEPVLVKKAMMVSIISLVISWLLLIYFLLKRASLSSRQL